MESTKEEMKYEAIRRMKQLKISQKAIDAFENKGEVWFSAHPWGTLFDAESEGYSGFIKAFEDNYGGLVYHCIETPMAFGRCLSMLFVSKYSDEWNSDWEDLNNGYAYAYVENIDAPYCSEPGTICVVPRWGGVIRTA